VVARKAMRWMAVAAALATQAASAQLLSQSKIAPVGGGNALSTPAARHIVRMDSGTYLLALQRDEAGTAPQTGLGLYRSDDDGQSWSFYASINPSPADRHTADLVKLGSDLAMVESFDAPSILPDIGLDPGRKVYFQRWRSNGASDFIPDARVAVFTPSTRGIAYHRGELAVDSLGRIWVQAFKRGSTACNPAIDSRCAICDTPGNGDNYKNDVVVSVSTDGGRTFSREQVLGSTLCRAGGRLISAGSRLLLIWNDYSGNEHGTRIVTRFVKRDAADPTGTWSAPQNAFPDDPPDGIYHGAALSAVADGSGVHLVYKDQNQMRLWYRRFDVATGAFGSKVQVDDSAQDWAMQPATTMRQGELFILDNHLLAAGRYQTRMWRLSTGLGGTKATAIATDDAFHGYPALPESLPAGARTLPYVFARGPTSDGPADEMVLRVAADQAPAVLSAAGRVVLPVGRTTAIRIQATASKFSGTVRFALTGLPAGVHASFDPPQVQTGGETTLTLSAEATTPLGSSSCSVAMTSDSASATIPFSLDLVAPPVVTLQGLASGSVLSGVARIVVQADASPGLGLAEVRLLVDGTVSATASGASASFSWDTTEAAEGAHDVTAVAVDEIGNSSSTDPVRVEVRNGGSAGGGCTSAGAPGPLLAVALALWMWGRKSKSAGAYPHLRCGSA
jgi:Big-like domain-containing protein